MGTHNHLTALSAQSFLEIIARDPDSPAVARKRWFRLDEPAFIARLDIAPLLTTWVVATPDLQASIDAAEAAGIDAGQPVSQTRGDLTWQIALRADGTLACDGTFPILIQWPDTVNPVERMVDQGIRLQRLSLTYPNPDQLALALSAIGADHLVTIEAGESSICASLIQAGQGFQVINNL